ncbi:LysR family transcriptional regulator [Streptomyces sp. NPDC058682]|uniref:LysR family transcriptional regulator n=1 Tax=Streptomyces sp. NPDC058682 TaxID=3346596 RepID=UPI00364FB4A0
MWRTFVTVCRIGSGWIGSVGSLSAAAAALNCSQPAGSRQIARPERRLGAGPVPVGEAFRRHADRSRMFYGGVGGVEGR